MKPTVIAKDARSHVLAKLGEGKGSFSPGGGASGTAGSWPSEDVVCSVLWPSHRTPEPHLGPGWGHLSGSGLGPHTDGAASSFEDGFISK